MTDETIPTVPMACYEAQVERYSHIIRCVVAGWAISVIALSLSVAVVLMA